MPEQHQYRGNITDVADSMVRDFEGYLPLTTPGTVVRRAQGDVSGQTADVALPNRIGWPASDCGTGGRMPAAPWEAAGRARAIRRTLRRPAIESRAREAYPPLRERHPVLWASHRSSNLGNAVLMLVIAEHDGGGGLLRLPREVGPFNRNGGAETSVAPLAAIWTSIEDSSPRRDV